MAGLCEGDNEPPDPLKAMTYGLSSELGNAIRRRENPPDTSPYDFDLFSKMELPLRGVHFRTRQAIIAGVEQSVRKLVQEDVVDGIRRLPEVWRRVLHVGGDYF
ncbi:hypothetical protein ANN_20726 [Periplaneta americana]|uniref:Uncharacterized protein n=1 Tax=Periplaneta americana TaxID=6978 RepID=A0ABQ8SEI2_PERAM|nr:hypothetical protein ANN_20726 [Periplaneta americana]